MGPYCRLCNAKHFATVCNISGCKPDVGALNTEDPGDFMQVKRLCSNYKFFNGSAPDTWTVQARVSRQAVERSSDVAICAGAHLTVSSTLEVYAVFTPIQTCE